MKKMQFMNTYINNITMLEAVDAIDKLTAEKINAYVVTPNVDHIVRIENDKEFREIYNNANLVLTDGQPLIWISKLYKKPIVEKVSGSDLFPKVCEMAARRGYKLFFLGAEEGVADIASEKLRKKHQGIQIVGTYSPKFGFEKDENEIRKMLSIVKKANPDILILALGTPKQEKFYYKYRNELDVPMMLAIGASIDFIAGKVKRAPKWMSNHGLEWLFRFCKEPKRMFTRYFIVDTKIIGLLWKYKR